MYVSQQNHIQGVKHALNLAGMEQKVESVSKVIWCMIKTITFFMLLFIWAFSIPFFSNHASLIFELRK